MNNIINTLVNFKLTTISNYLETTNNNNEEVLEPFCTMVKLCLLSIKPSNTKISINNNSISYHEPTLYQSVIRWKNGDRREHIHNLFNPLNKFLLWFDTNDEKIKYILKLSKDGLDCLLKCYSNQDSVICHSILYYIKIINEAIEETTTKEDVDKNNISDTDIYYIKLNHLWDSCQIGIVYDILIQIFKTTNTNEQNIYINSLENIINEKEKIVYEIVKKVSTIL